VTTSAVETATCGSELLTLPPELQAKVKSKVRATLFQGYGLSESVGFPLCSWCSGGVHILVADPRRLAITETMQENYIPGYKPIHNSFGLLVSGLQARIIREGDRDGGVGEPGELLAKEDDISSMTTRPPARGYSLKMGGSRRVISSPPMRTRETSSEITHGPLTCVAFVYLT